MDDMADFKRKYFQDIIDEEIRILSENKNLIEDFKKYVCQFGIELNDDNFRYHQNLGIVATYPNLVRNLDNSLIPDKENLLDFDVISGKFARRKFANGYLYGQNFMLMANAYFRRGFNYKNNFTPRLIELFWNVKLSNVDTYISLDSDRVRIDVDNSMIMEFDTWFGASFFEDISQIADGNTKLRPPVDIDDFDVSFFFSGAYSLDIKWATKNNIKTFQAEEFKTEKILIEKDGLKYHPVRYIHAEFDLEKGCFRHFDGAIHFYTPDEYFRRRDSDFNYNSKSSTHIKTLSEKLFKINGVVDVKTWVEYSCHFLSGNPLAIEYFAGEYPEHIRDFLEKVRA